MKMISPDGKVSIKASQHKIKAYSKKKSKDEVENGDT